MPTSPPETDAVEVSAPESVPVEPTMALGASDIERPDPTGKSTRRRRLSIISLPNVQTNERAAEEKDTEGRTIQTSGDHLVSVIGLYTGEENPLLDDGAGADPETSDHVHVVSTIGYTSKAGSENSGHKKTNQDAFVVLQVHLPIVVTQ